VGRLSSSTLVNVVLVNLIPFLQANLNQNTEGWRGGRGNFLIGLEGSIFTSFSRDVLRWLDIELGDWSLGDWCSTPNSPDPPNVSSFHSPPSSFCWSCESGLWGCERVRGLRCWGVAGRERGGERVGSNFGPVGWWTGRGGGQVFNTHPRTAPSFHCAGIARKLILLYVLALLLLQEVRRSTVIGMTFLTFSSTRGGISRSPFQFILLRCPNWMIISPHLSPHWSAAELFTMEHTYINPREVAGWLRAARTSSWWLCVVAKDRTWCWCRAVGFFRPTRDPFSDSLSAFSGSGLLWSFFFCFCFFFLVNRWEEGAGKDLGRRGDSWSGPSSTFVDCRVGSANSVRTF